MGIGVGLFVWFFCFFVLFLFFFFVLFFVLQTLVVAETVVGEDGTNAVLTKLVCTQADGAACPLTLVCVAVINMKR